MWCFCQCHGQHIISVPFAFTLCHPLSHSLACSLALFALHLNTYDKINSNRLTCLKSQNIFYHFHSNVEKEKEPSICYYLSRERRADSTSQNQERNNRKNSTQLNAHNGTLHRFIVKPAFQFEIQFNSMARAIIYVDSTLIVYCFACATCALCVCWAVYSLLFLFFLFVHFTPERLHDSVKLAIVTSSTEKELALPPIFSFISLFLLPFAIPFFVNIIFIHIGIHRHTEHKRKWLRLVLKSPAIAWFKPQHLQT